MSIPTSALTTSGTTNASKRQSIAIRIDTSTTGKSYERSTVCLSFFVDSLIQWKWFIFPLYPGGKHSKWGNRRYEKLFGHLKENSKIYRGSMRPCIYYVHTIKIYISHREPFKIPVFTGVLYDTCQSQFDWKKEVMIRYGGSKDYEGKLQREGKE